MTGSEKRRGFTLIELLIVIAIIAILAAILFPVFARARAKARQASCQSNLKQIALAVKMYQSDYDNGLPGYYLNGLTWNQLLIPYTKSTQIFNCPEDTPFKDHVPPWDGTGNGYLNIGYGATPLFMWSGFGPFVDRTPPDLGRLGDLANIAMVADSNIYLVDPVGAVFAPSASSAGSAVQPRHNGMCDVAFMDGHVKAMNTDKLKETVQGGTQFVLDQNLTITLSPSHKSWKYFGYHDALNNQGTYDPA